MGPGAASYGYIFLTYFFRVTRDHIDHFDEEIILIPFFHRLAIFVHNYHLLSFYIQKERHHFVKNCQNRQRTPFFRPRYSRLPCASERCFRK